MKNKNKYYVFKAFKEKAELYIYGEITSDKWYESDVTANDFKDELAKHKGKDLDIYINSPGGSVWEAQAIVSMLQRHDGVKTAYIDGLAASAASFIALSCDKVIIPENAYLMIHKAWGVSWGNADELRKQAEMLDKVDDGILGIYMKKAKISEDEMKQLVADETWLTGTEALDVFDIEGVESKEIATCADMEILSKYKNTPEPIASNLISAISENLETITAGVLSDNETLPVKEPENNNNQLIKDLEDYLALQ